MVYLERKESNMSNSIPVSCIVVTHNRRRLLEKCLKSIIDQNYKNYEIIIVDDASTDGTYEFLRKLIREIQDTRKNINIKVIRNREQKFVAECRNIGAKFAKGMYLLFIDDDVVLDENCVKELVDFMEKYPDFVAATPLILDTLGNLWNAGVKRNYLGINYSYPIPKQRKEYIIVDECITIYIIRREEFEKINGYNNRFRFYYEESEMFHRLKKATKKKIACVLKARAYHYVEKDKLWKISPLKAYLLGRNRIWFYKKWCKNIVHYALCTLVWIFLCCTFYLMNFIVRKNFKAFKYLVRGVKDGLFTLP